jgi:hypothetical protein
MTTADGLLMPAVIVWTKEPALVSSVSELEVWLATKKLPEASKPRASGAVPTVNGEFSSVPPAAVKPETVVDVVGVASVPYEYASCLTISVRACSRNLISA